MWDIFIWAVLTVGFVAAAYYGWKRANRTVDVRAPATPRGSDPVPPVEPVTPTEIKPKRARRGK